MKAILLDCHIVNADAGKTIKGSIVIERGIIMEAGPITRPHTSDYELIDCSNLFAMAGLIDLHQHIGGDTHPLAENYLGIEDGVEQFLDIATRNLRDAMAGGVVAIREMGTYLGRTLELRDAIKRGVGSWPLLHSCGHILTYPGGHGSAYGVEVQGETALVKATAELIEAGVDLIKIASDPEDTEASGSIPNSAFSVNELRAVVRTAHSAGVKVACHTFPSSAGVSRAIEAGIDTLEHAVPFDNAMIQRLNETGQFIVPTVVAAADEFSPDQVEEFIGIPASTWVNLSSINFPPTLLRERWAGPPDSIKVWMSRLVEFLPAAIASGVSIGIGTDAGCRGTNSRSAVREMHLLAACGASNSDVIRYATINGARALGRTDIGRLEPGKMANIVFTLSNPLLDLMTLAYPAAVILAGRWTSQSAPQSLSTNRRNQ